MVAISKRRSKIRIRWADRLRAAMLLALAATGAASSAQAQESWISRWNANSYNNYVEAGYNQQDTDFVSNVSSEKPGHAYVRAAKSIANDKVYLFGGFSRASYESHNASASGGFVTWKDKTDVTSSRIQIGAGSTYELNPNMDLIAEASIVRENLEYTGTRTTTTTIPPNPPTVSTSKVSLDAKNNYTAIGGGVYFRPDSLNNTAWWAKVTRESRFSAFALEVGGQLQITPNFSVVGQINTYDTTEVLVYGAGVRFNF